MGLRAKAATASRELKNGAYRVHKAMRSTKLILNRWPNAHLSFEPESIWKKQWKGAKDYAVLLPLMFSQAPNLPHTISAKRKETLFFAQQGKKAAPERADGRIP